MTVCLYNCDPAASWKQPWASALYLTKNALPEHCPRLKLRFHLNLPYYQNKRIVSFCCLTVPDENRWSNRTFICSNDMKVSSLTADWEGCLKSKSPQHQITIALATPIAVYNCHFAFLFLFILSSFILLPCKNHYQIPEAQTMTVQMETMTIQDHYFVRYSRLLDYWRWIYNTISLIWQAFL